METYEVFIMNHSTGSWDYDSEVETDSPEETRQTIADDKDIPLNDVHLEVPDTSHGFFLS